MKVLPKPILFKTASRNVWSAESKAFLMSLVNVYSECIALYIKIFRKFYYIIWEPDSNAIIPVLAACCDVIGVVSTDLSFVAKTFENKFRSVFNSEIDLQFLRSPFFKLDIFFSVKIYFLLNKEYISYSFLFDIYLMK